jgi:leader peptidase (prepilin peptidase)/N-methyltransferase
MTVVHVLIALPLGLVFGSFLTVVVHRVPAGESIVRPRSRCPSCGAQLRATDNVPVVWWLLLRGRCRSCGTRISVVYPLIELATAGLFVGAALRIDDPWLAALLAPFSAVLLALAVIDWRTKKLPNRIVYPSVLVSAGYLLVARVAGAPVHLAGAGVGFLAYGGGMLIVALIVPRGMGMGDVKLAGLIGLVLGALGVRFVGVAAAVGILIGGVAAVVALLFGATRKTGIPYGPSMALGAVVSVFAGSEIADAYLQLLGA